MSTLPKKLQYYLVQFAYGASAGSFVRLTNRASNKTYDGNTYTSTMQLAVRPPANTADLDEKALEVDVPTSAHALFTALASTEPVSPVFVTVVHINEPLADDGGSDEEIVMCVSWRLVRATKSPSRRRGIVRLEAVSAKSELRDAVGMPANYQCGWTLFGQGCDLALVSDSGTLTAIDATDPKKVTITSIAADPGVPGATPGKTYHNGYVEKDGIRVPIRDYSPAAPTIFWLRRKPPAAWVGQTVTVVAGCDKTVETCGDRWDNVERFSGTGYAIPDRHPVFELPPS